MQQFSDTLKVAFCQCLLHVLLSAFVNHHTFKYCKMHYFVNSFICEESGTQKLSFRDILSAACH